MAEDSYLSGVGDYLGRSAEAFGRIPRDVKKWWYNLPESTGDYGSAIWAPTYAADAASRMITRQGLPELYEAAGLPAERTRENLERFRGAYGGPLEAVQNIAEAAAGAEGTVGMTPKEAWRASEPARGAFAQAAVETGQRPSIFIGPVGVENLFRAGRPAAKEALQIADKLKEEGKGRDEIYAVTSDYFRKHDPELAGVHYGPEGIPRVEISEHNVPWIGGTAETMPKHGVELTEPGKAWPHSTLYQAYPVMRERGLIVSNPSELQTNVPFASYDPRSKSTALNLNPKYPAKSLMSHETTHGVQDIEGMLGGGNWRDFLVGQSDVESVLRGKPESAGLAKAVIESANRHLGFSGKTVNELKDFAEKSDLNIADLSHNLRHLVARDKYVNLYGEMEARNAQTRYHMTPEERRLSPSWTTQDVPEERLITGYGSGHGAMAHGQTEAHPFMRPVEDMQTPRGAKLMPESNFDAPSAVKFVHPESNLAKWHEDKTISGGELYKHTKNAVSGVKAINEFATSNKKTSVGAQEFVDWARSRHQPFSENPRESRLTHSIQDAEDAGYVHVDANEQVRVTPIGRRALERFRESRFADGGIVHNPRLEYHQKIRSQK